MEFRHLVQHARTHSQRRSPETGRRLAAGQSPTALFITCADSRIVPAAITGAEPGSLFELRTAGNVIPAFTHHSASSEMATIEFAVVQLGVSEIVVCGHSHCGAVRALHGGRPALDHLPTMLRWLATHAPFRTTAPTEPGMRAEGQEHVLAQLRALEGYPFVRDRVAAGDLRTHGWFYDIESGEVSAFAADRFQPL
ncbi:carbonic anhydrase [Saccharothrix tamanrassetensis]|uniref:Carbonic anhydrase n=1 Tax=Saccharothrix tamanrassetensis TaxID=1051531 RepID=A0A841CL53_9PSEU|nr:carbonic anhydrase [Saccharothrix tamanrassetensis]MBB5957820.1 carbonic anhydrase [Saccharothrix tamanrassetensis]